jgi:cell division protease FtsH
MPEDEPLDPAQRRDREGDKPRAPGRSPMPRDQRGWNVSPAPDGRGTPAPTDGGKGGRPNMSFGRGLAIFVVILLALNYGSWLLLRPSGTATIQIPYNPIFLKQVTDGNVKAISAEGTTIQGKFAKPVTYPASGPTAQTATVFTTEVPVFINSDQLSNTLITHNVEIDAHPDTQGQPSTLVNILVSFGPTLLILVLLFFVFRRMSRAGAGGPLGAFGRSKARRVDQNDLRVTFDDVAGIDEAKDELYEVVDFLRKPERYAKLGGRIPHGVLLSGRPGTGKTLLARAVAGEAHAAFFSISASEFVEAIVGVGASRVRDLFKQAKEAAPAIIFIDELDAIGRSRANAVALSGANDEREQTLNQILTEMDGFETSVNVVVLAATNRPEILDQALLRPGRFDRRVAVQPPDREGRKKILAVHVRHIPLADHVDLDALAASTPGMVGADLANLANEAALTAARHNQERVRQSDFMEALEKIMLGAPRGVVLSPADRERTAYHEAGHALVGMLSHGADPVRKVSIIPRGMALGVTLSTPDTDIVNYQKEDLEAKIRVALGGRTAEEIVYGSISTGAQSDIENLTQIARHMVGSWGMSEAIGPVAVLPSDAMGPYLPGASATSEHTQRVVDQEVRRIVDQAHDEVIELLTTHRDQLDNLTRALLEKETLDELDAYAAAGVPRVRQEEHRAAGMVLASAQREIEPPRSS